MSQALVGNIVDWKVIGGTGDFTILALTTDNKVVFWREGKWNELL